MPTKASTWPFGGGETGALVRARDWAATPLGPIDRWPAQLKTAVDICLSSAHACAVLWGQDLILIYNDPFRDRIGDKHPAVFGSPARLGWTEIWDEIGPLVKRVMDSDEAISVADRPLRLNRSDRDETGYFSLSFNPIHAEDGAMLGVFHIALETTDRVLSDRALRESEAHYRHTVELNPQITWTAQPDGDIDYISERWRDWTGSEGTGSSYQRSIHPDDLAHALAAYRHAIQSGEPFDAEHRIRLRSGEYRWIHTRAYPRRDEQGRIVKWYGSSEDVHERYLALERVRANEEFLRQALEIGRMIAYEWDLKTWESTRSGSTAGAFAHLTGRAEDFFRILHPDDEPRLRAQSEAAARGDREFYEAEYRIVGSNGELFWISSQSRLTRDDDGRPARLAGIAQDITERKLSEQSLADSEERLRLATEVGGMGAWDWNLVDDHFTFSDQLYLLLGHSVGAVAPSYTAWAERIHPDDRVEAEAAFSRARDTGEIYVCDYRIVTPDGSVRCCKARGRFYYDSAGKPVRMIGVIQDVTTEREAEARQRLLLGELQHRVRNTLAIVRSIARRTATTTETVEDYTAHFDGRLNAFARTQAAVTRDPAAGVDLEALVAEELMAHGAREGLQVEIEGPAVRLQPKAAETLGLAIHELATNAVKYGALVTPSGRIDVRWKVEEGDDSRRLTLDWSEDSAARLIAPPRRRGFGTELLERTLAYDLGARTELRFEPQGLKCTIVMPLTERTVIA